MKRGGPLKRNTPLRRTEFVKKPAKVQKGWAKAVAVVKARSGGLCEIQTHLCTGRGQQIDHVIRRSQGGGADPNYLQHGCQPCHQFVTEHPAISFEKGWTKHSWDRDE